MTVLMGIPRFCKWCRKRETFLSVDTSAALTGCNRSTVYRWISEGLLHVHELANGRPLVCMQSLMKVHEVDLPMLARLEASSRRRT
jgi:excisionase family DNA binding protein